MITFDSRFFPDPETEEIIDSHVFTAGDKVRVEIEAAEPVRVVVFRVKPECKTKVRVASYEGIFKS